MPAASNQFWVRVLRALNSHQFALIDIGCSGGIDPTWFEFGNQLQAFGFDPNIEEVERLNAAPPLPGIEYIAGFVGLELDHPFQAKRREAGLYGGNYWGRLAFQRSVEHRETLALSNQQKTEQNRWPQLRLADPENPIFIPQFVRDRGINNIDFIKLDIDGLDYDVLHSIEPLLTSHDVLGLQMEVNFCGRANDADHTFHNTDLFLRRNGYELVDLSIRRYGLDSLPRPYLLSFPAQSAKGRPYQGDALYIRDLGWVAKAPLPENYPPEKLLKLAAIFHLMQLDDHAAELLVHYREQLAPHIDVTAALDELASAAMENTAFHSEPRTYARYMELFAQDDSRFYPQPSTSAPTSWRHRLAAFFQGPIKKAP